MMPVSVCLSVRLSVTEVHWRIIANLGFKFRSKFTARARMHAGAREGIIAGKSGGIISRYASNFYRPSCLHINLKANVCRARNFDFIVES